MKVVVFLYECSRVGSDEFEKQGWLAISCDYKASERNGYHHIQGNVWDYDWSFADIVIAHPDCTNITNSGVRWLHERPERWDLMVRDAKEFKRVLELPVDMLCVENPIPHKYALEIIGKDYTQIIHPHYFIGSDESKATCLWLKGLPKLVRTQWLDKSEIKQSVWREPPGENRQANRARTSTSIAKAMSNQWCNL